MMIQATSQPETPAGYTLVSSQFSGGYTDWSAWSDWSRTAVSNTDTRNVESRNIAAKTHTEYNYSRYYSDDKKWTAPTSGYWNGYNCRNYVERGWGEQLPYYSTQYFSDGTPFTMYGVEYNVWYNQVTRTVTDQAAYTEYRYRTRSELNNYYYQSSFSDWQTTPVTASDTRQVETRTVYRYRFVIE